MQYNAVQVSRRHFLNFFPLFSPYQTASFGRFLIHVFFLRDHTPGPQLFRSRKSNRSVLATLKVLLPLTPMVKSPFFRRQNRRSEGLAVILLHYLLRVFLEEESSRLSGFGKVKIIISELVRRQLTVRKEKIPFPRKEKLLIELLSIS